MASVGDSLLRLIPSDVVKTTPVRYAQYALFSQIRDNTYDYYHILKIIYTLKSISHHQWSTKALQYYLNVHVSKTSTRKISGSSYGHRQIKDKDDSRKRKPNHAIIIL